MPREEDLWWSILRHPKLLIFVFVSPFIIWLGADELYFELSESSPTDFRAERFGDEYRGQRWLTVEGRLLPEYADWHPNGERYANVYVPLVSLSWQKGDPVQIVANFSILSSVLGEWRVEKSRSPEYTLRGCAEQLGPMRYQDMFRTLQFREPVVFINEGQRPNPLRGIALLALGGFTLVSSWLWFAAVLVSTWRRLRETARIKHCAGTAGSTITAYAVRLESLTKLIGSRDKIAIAAVVGNQAQFLSAIDCIDDQAETKCAEIVAALIGGEPRADAPDYLYGYALEAICGYLGCELPDISYLPDVKQWIKEIDGVLKGEGILLTATRLVTDCSALQIPGSDNFPTVGVWPAAEIPAALASLRRIDRKVLDREMADTVAQMLRWLEAAVKAPGASIVGFLS